MSVNLCVCVCVCVCVGGATGRTPPIPRSALEKMPVQEAQAGDSGSIPGLGRSPEGGNGTPLQYFCLENPMDRGACQATVHGVAKSLTQLSAHIPTPRPPTHTPQIHECGSHLK